MACINPAVCSTDRSKVCDGPGVSLTRCFVVYSTRRFVIMLLCYVILFLCLSFLLACDYAALGRERANLSAFHTFVRFALVWFCMFPLPPDV